MSDVGDLFDSDDALSAAGESAPVEKALGKADKVVVGCFGCASLVSGSIGMILGAGLGVLYHTFLGQDGSFPGHVAAGALLGGLVGARLFFPVEEFVIELIVDKVFGLFRKKGKSPPAAPPT